MERADEPALAGSATLDDPDAAMAARVLECPHAQVISAHHNDRLIENLVLDEVVWLRDLLEPAGHLPDPRPQEIDFHLVEVRVEIALLARPVRELHGVGHGECRPLSICDRHPAPFFRRAFGRVYTDRSTGRYKFFRHPHGLIGAEAHDIP